MKRPGRDSNAVRNSWMTNLLSGLDLATLLYFPAKKIRFDAVEGLPNC